MEDRHSAEISAGLKAIASAISGLGFSILFGLMYVGCMMSFHH